MNELLKLAPTILGALANPIAGVAGLAAEYVAGKLGLSDKSVEGVKAALAGLSGEDRVKLAQIDADLQTHLADNGIALELAQLKVNEEEAKSADRFIAGWRPAVGWVCVASLALVYWPKALMLAALWCYQAIAMIHAAPAAAAVVLPAYPDLGLTDVLGLLGAMLGLGGMRTMEKLKGAEGNR
jgi:hypothetical protein